MAEPSDYTKSSYAIGHMAPANNFTRSVEAMKATFILTYARAAKAVSTEHEEKEGQDTTA
jgi:hypothetical protein